MEDLTKLTKEELIFLSHRIKNELLIRETQETKSKKVIADFSFLTEKVLAPSYARTHKEWIKELSGVNTSQTNGYAFEGKFLNLKAGQLVENIMYADKFYLVYGDYGSVKNHHPYAMICRFDLEAEKFERVADFQAFGFDWVLTLRDHTAKLFADTFESNASQLNE